MLQGCVLRGGASQLFSPLCLVVLQACALGSGLWDLGSEQVLWDDVTLGSGLWAVDSGLWALASGPWTLGSGL